MTYPSAYKTFKDTLDFTWIQKPIQKGHMNIIAYTLPINALKENIKKRIPVYKGFHRKSLYPGKIAGFLYDYREVLIDPTITRLR